MKVESDGIVFHKETVTATRITEDADYKGVRVFLRGSLSSTRLFLQIDIGFGDVIIPPNGSRTWVPEFGSQW